MKRIAVTLAPFAFLLMAALPVQAAETKGDPGMKKAPDAKMAAGKSAAGQVHKGQGTVNGVDTKAGKVNLTHGAIATLNWPGMTMDFKVKDKALLKGVAPGQNVEFDIVQQGPGEFVITRIAPAARKKSGKAT
jgi:Cu/Ag efflux protein CusF